MKDGSRAWLARARDAQLQALEDVACAGSASVSMLESEDDPSAFLGELAEAARGRGFAVARASLAEHGLQSLDELVRAFAEGLLVPGAARAGIPAALDAFVAAGGRRAEERFETAAEAEAFSGDLRALASAYVGAASGRAAARRLGAWLRGDEAASTADRPLRALSLKTAMSALAQLTRLVRVLGHRGTLLVGEQGEALVELPPARRDLSFTVLRELVDNGDWARGMVATKLLIVGPGSLFSGARSMASHGALASRLGEGSASAPSPHAPRTSLAPLAGVVLGQAPAVREVEPRKARPLRALLRVEQGLPPLEASVDLTVGMDEIDRRLDGLFEHASHDGSVFAVLVGAFGAGKTHHLLHIEARAIAERRPVFWLSIERLDEDLGNPQRHLRRLLEGGTLPFAGAPSPLERLQYWLRSNAGRKRLRAALDAAASGDGEAAGAARRALRGSTDGELDEAAVAETLGALDLVDKPSQPSYRRDAYARLFLWLELFSRLDGCEGPLVLLDEAENLYRPGVSRAERRTALRSLSFYCGGALPRACVVLAVTPESLEALRAEADELLDAIEEQRTLLPLEDAAMLRRRLTRAKPLQTVKLGREALLELGERARALDEKVHGRITDPGWEAFLRNETSRPTTPRELLRRATLRLERLRW